MEDGKGGRPSDNVGMTSPASQIQDQPHDPARVSESRSSPLERHKMTTFNFRHNHTSPILWSQRFFCNRAVARSILIPELR